MVKGAIEIGQRGGGVKLRRHALESLVVSDAALFSTRDRRWVPITLPFTQLSRLDQHAGTQLITKRSR